MSGQRQLKNSTYADYLQINDGKRYELIQGQYWLMAGAGALHQRAVVELVMQIGAHLKGKICRVFVAPFDVRIAEANDNDGFESNVVQPDVLINCDRTKETPTGIKGAPDVVIEVVSPNGSGCDLVIKRRMYERAGVRACRNIGLSTRTDVCCTCIIWSMASLNTKA